MTTMGRWRLTGLLMATFQRINDPKMSCSYMNLIKQIAAVVTIGLFAPLVASQAAEQKLSTPSAKKAPPGRYRLVEGKGYTVCEAFLKNLNAFPASDPPMVCGPKINSAHPEFSIPKWEDMDVQSNLNLIYAAEAQMWHLTPVGTKPLPYAQWLVKFQQRLKSGEIRPRLRKTVLALNERGPETLISYETVADECVIEWKSVAVGRYIFVLREKTEVPLEKISSFDPDHSDIILFKGKPYFLSASVDVEYVNDDPKNIWWLPLDRMSNFKTDGEAYLRTGICAYHVDRVKNQ
jgi:hypothetical protein